MSIAGTEPGERQLNGPQTTGRTYRNLSAPEHAMARDNNIAVPMRDGVTLLADVHRPAEPGRYPVLIAASPYPRQLQDLGAPAGFIEAGASDFFVPRGYVHLIVNLRGTGGSGGTFGLFDAQERRDMHDLVEWAAAQPWCDGNVGMIGISYFAMTQLEAAVERPPHLKAIFPVAVTADLYEAVSHHGLFSSSFITPFVSVLGMTSQLSDRFLRSELVEAVRTVLHVPAIHRKFATMNGEASITALRLLMKLHHDPHPWDDYWRAVAVERPVRDAWWEERNLMPLLHRIEIPVYLGCDWQNVPLHLPSTFPAFNALKNSNHVRVAMLGDFGLTWPWESLHVEALAWYDHWLKGKDTGILEGPRIRYVLPGATGFHAADAWPLPGVTYRDYALRADGGLAADEGTTGTRTMMTLGSGLNRAHPSETDPPAMLTWNSEPLERDLDMTGPVELALDATATAIDTAFIVTLQDVDPSGNATDITAGYLRASLREVDEAASRPGAPVLPCRSFEAVPVGQLVRYRIPMVDNARRFKSGHCIRLVLTGDDQNPEAPSIMGFRHASAGTSCLSTIMSSSRLLLPVLNG
ncbi:CocE/NonD family hydrolase [Pseudorhodoplanes sp.]|uniref:CocE/NonD family hydrolase n=1 Tax=Pseudorhodoplanes sp. TaxID=1934341 RepID=UPI003D0DE299